MRYQFYYYIKASEHLPAFLKENKIKYKAYDDGYIKFSIFSSQPGYEALLNKLTTVFSCKKPKVICDYSAKDRNEAEFLWITPYKYCIEIKNIDEAYQYTCRYEHRPTGTTRAHHVKQVGALQITRIPKLNTKTAFYARDVGRDELFVDYRIKELSEKHQLRGLVFQPLLLRNRQESQDIFHLTSPHILDISAVVRGHGEDSAFCPLCGKEDLIPSSSYQMHLHRSHLDLSLDLMSTDRIWGEGISYSMHIISQKFYQILLEEKLTGSLNIEPVVLHD